MPLNEKQILAIFKNDYTSSEDYHDTWADKRSTWIAEENGEPYGNEEKGKSTLVSRDIKKVNMQQHSAIIDPFVSGPELVDTHPVTEEDRPTSDQAELLLNYQFCRDFPRYNFVSDAYKVQQREGIVVAKVAWEAEEGEVEEERPVMETTLVPGPQGLVPQEIQVGTEMVTVTKLIKNRPTAEVCDNSMLYIDPTCIGDISNAQFVVQRYMSNISKLKSSGLYKNLNKLDALNSSMPYTGEADDYDKRDTNDFSFQDKPRQELEVYEYWGNYDLNDDGIAEAIVCVWVGNTVIRLEENPYPDKQIPFISCAYNSEPFSINGTANADLLSVDQRIKTSIKRAMNNTLDAGTQGQKGYPKGMLDPINAKRFKEGKDFEFNMGEAANIWVGQFADIPNSTMNYYQSVSDEISSISGVIPNGRSGASALGSSATAASGILGATERREIDISRNLKENLFIPLFRKWHSMNAVFLDDEQIIRITNNEFVTIRRDDLYGNIDIDITVSTPATDVEKANDLSFMLQTMGPTLPFEMTQLILSEIAKLKRMPDLSSQIKEYQPQPNPLAQKREELEIQKLEAEIMERQSRARENQVDMELKSAKADNERAKSRKTHSDADTTDLDFLRKQSGQDVADAMKEQNNKDMNQGMLNRQKTNS